MGTNHPALNEFLHSIPLFRDVSSDELQDVLRLLRPVRLEVRQVLFRQGAPGKSMWILGEGATVSLSSRGLMDNQPVAVAEAREGDVVGEMALVDEGVRSASAEVTCAGQAFEVSALDFFALRESFRPAAYKILRRICGELCLRLRRTNERIVPSVPSAIETPPLPLSPRATIEQIEKFPAFRRFPAVVKLALAQKLSYLSLDAMTPLFAEGDVSDAAYFIVEGSVAVGRAGRTLATLESRSLFGLVSVIDKGLRSASCITEGPAALLRLSQDDFEGLFNAGNRFAYQLVELVARQLVHHLRDANQMLPELRADPSLGFSPVASIAPMHEEDLLPEAEILPLELEMQLAEFRLESEMRQ